MPAPAAAEAAAVAAVSPSMSLLLSAALLPPDEAAGAWASWLGSVDFERLEDGATALLSLVSTNLPDLQVAASIDGRVRGVQRQTWAANQLLWSAGRPLLDQLADGAGPPLVLPPVSLLPATRGAWGARPFHRIELGFRPELAEDVRAALAATGWPVDHLTPNLLRRTRAAMVPRWQASDAAGNWVSIRWHVLRGIKSQPVDEALRGASLVCSLGASRVRVLHPADALVERLWNTRTEPGHPWMVDVVLLARQLVIREVHHCGEPDLDVVATAALARFAARSRAFGIQGALRARLATVAGVIPDGSVRAALAALEAEPVRRAERLWALPARVAPYGRSWAGHAAGQGLARGAGSGLRARLVAVQLRRQGAAERP